MAPAAAAACPSDGPGFPELRKQDLFGACEGVGEERLRELLRTAEFWIAVLEGEQEAAAAEAAQERREQEAARAVAEEKAAARSREVLELEGERRRLQAEVGWLRSSRDEALCQKALLQHDGHRVRGDAETQASKAGALEAELSRERAEKSDLEAQYVRAKVRFAEAMELADGMESTILGYEEQLLALNPSFEPARRVTLGQWRKHFEVQPDDDTESTGSGVADARDVASSAAETVGAAEGSRRRLKAAAAAVSKLGRHFRKDRRSSREDIGASEPRRTSRDESLGGAAADASPGGGEDAVPRAKRRWEMRVEE